jgi:hypothetical protein
MQAMTGPATWYVAAGQGAEYASAGAAAVVEAGALCRARNAALDEGHAAGAAVVELSDDLRGCKLAQHQGDKVIGAPIPFAAAVRAIRGSASLYGAKLAGVAPTSNPFYSNPKHPVRLAAFIVGDMICVEPCALRFDERFRLKEDYDYTLQHLAKYGRVVRCDTVLATFIHRSNAGGAVTVRTPALEQEAIALLKAKWPHLVADNPRRANEVLLRLPTALRRR